MAFTLVTLFSCHVRFIYGCDDIDNDDDDNYYYYHYYYYLYHYYYYSCIIIIHYACVLSGLGYIAC